MLVIGKFTYESDVVDLSDADELSFVIFGTFIASLFWIIFIPMFMFIVGVRFIGVNLIKWAGKDRS